MPPLQQEIGRNAALAMQIQTTIFDARVAHRRDRRNRNDHLRRGKRHGEGIATNHPASVLYHVAALRTQ
jgi:hypothetical protein